MTLFGVIIFVRRRGFQSFSELIVQILSNFVFQKRIVNCQEVLREKKTSSYIKTSLKKRYLKKHDLQFRGNMVDI